MKKFVLILLTIVSLFALVACKEGTVIDDETAITASFTDESINQNSITVKLTVDDPEDEITGTIYARLYNADDEAISSRSFSKSTTGDYAIDGATITFAGLGLEQSYYIIVEATVDRDVIAVERFTFQTIGTIHISTVEEFLAMDAYRGADYVLDNDLDFEGIDYISPFDTTYFSGTFDGQNHTLSNINITTSNSTTNPDSNYYYIGVFGYVSSAANVSNLTVDHVTIGTLEAPQAISNLARIGFLFGYVASSNVSIENVHVTNSHYYITSSSDDFVYIGGIAGELKGTLNGATISNSSISLETTSIDNNEGYLVKMGGVVGFSEVDSEIHEVNADIDLSYQTYIDAFDDEDQVKVAIGGAIGDKLASENSSNVSDVVVTGNIDVYVDIQLAETFTTGTYTLYVGGLIGNSSLKVKDGFFAGNINVEHVSADADTGVYKRFFVGGLVGNYQPPYALNAVVWVPGDTGITVSAAADVVLNVGSLIGKASRELAHVYGVVGVESVVINDVAQDLTAPVIADMTDYFSSEFANDAYSDLIAN